MNDIQWTPKATRQLRKLRDSELRKRLYRGVQLLADFPRCQGVKRLTDHQYTYRLRIGNYRVFFEFETEIKVISIEEVKKRDERTY